jgi:hypothetical protein
MATIHPQLMHDCQLLGRFTLSHLLLMRDANYPWCILVPDLDGISEIHQLSESDQQQLLRESSRRWVMLCHSCTCIISPVTVPMPPGPRRCGAGYLQSPIWSMNLRPWCIPWQRC